jgi:hypothetical protein
VGAELEHPAQQLVPAVVREPHVHEARAGHFGIRHQALGGAQLGNQLLGDGTGVLAQTLRHQHGGVAGEVAMSRVVGHFEHEVRRRIGIAGGIEKLSYGALELLEESLFHAWIESPGNEISSRISIT